MNQFVRQLRSDAVDPTVAPGVGTRQGRTRLPGGSSHHGSDCRCRSDDIARDGGGQPDPGSGECSAALRWSWSNRRSARKSLTRWWNPGKPEGPSCGRYSGFQFPPRSCKLAPCSGVSSQVTSGSIMLQINPASSANSQSRARSHRPERARSVGHKKLEPGQAGVRTPVPGVDPKTWYQVCRKASIVTTWRDCGSR